MPAAQGVFAASKELVRRWYRGTDIKRFALAVAEKLSSKRQVHNLIFFFFLFFYNLHYYTVFQKTSPQTLAVTLTLTDFKNSFSDRLGRTFAIQPFVDIPSHLMHVAALPCETWMTEKPTKFTVFQKTSWCIFVISWPNAVAKCRLISIKFCTHVGK